MDRRYPYVHLFLGHAYTAKGMHASAVAAYEEAVRLGLDSPTTQGRLAAAYANARQRDRTLAILTQLQARNGAVSPVELAIVYTSLGRKEQAFASLEQAHASRDPQLQLIGAVPVFDPLRADPRFNELVRRVGLAP
jgi:tetratricopeptide (TPR) repeat protein